MEKKSYIKFYWTVWLVIVAIFLFLRFGVFTEINEDLWFELFQWYAIPTWSVIVILNIVEGQRLKNNHYDKWAELGGFNGFKRLKFLFSKNDLDDSDVAFF